jgi:hypothetical protein
MASVALALQLTGFQTMLGNLAAELDAAAGGLTADDVTHLRRHAVALKRPDAPDAGRYFENLANRVERVVIARGALLQRVAEIARRQPPG